MVDPVLSVRHLSVDFKTDDGLVHAVDDVSFELARGETLGIVGESGSGKTVSSLALLGLLPTTAAISGQAIFDGANLLALDERRLQPLRGDRIAMIFQDALAALNPVQRVGEHPQPVQERHVAKRPAVHRREAGEHDPQRGDRRTVVDQREPQPDQEVLAVLQRGQDVDPPVLPVHVDHHAQPRPPSIRGGSPEGRTRRIHGT